MVVRVGSRSTNYTQERGKQTKQKLKVDDASTAEKVPTEIDQRNERLGMCTYCRTFSKFI
jgi:hypothetical protein